MCVHVCMCVCVCVCVYLFNIFIEQFFYLVIILCDKSESESCSVMTNSVTPWTVACQAPLPMEFSRPEYWSGQLFLSPGDLSNPGIESRSLGLQAYSLPAEPPGKHPRLCDKVIAISKKFTTKQFIFQKEKID